MSKIIRSIYLDRSVDDDLERVRALVEGAPEGLKSHLGFDPDRRVSASQLIASCIANGVRNLEEAIAFYNDGAAVHAAQGGAKPADKATRKANATGGVRKHKSAGKAAA